MKMGNVTQTRIKKTYIFIISVAFLCCLATYFFIIKKEKYYIKKPENIIIIIWDAVRADATSPYKSPQDSSPFLNKLSKQGIVFENTYSQSSMTLYSITSLFTGMYPDFHGLVTMHGFLRKELLTLAEALRSNGYACFGFVSNPWLSAEKQFNRGFNYYKKMYDDEITRRALLVLNPEYINFSIIKNRNKFKPVKINKNNKKHLKAIFSSEGDLTGNGFRIYALPELSKKLTIANSTELSWNGEYYWGFTIHSNLKAFGKITMELTGLDENRTRKIIETKSSTICKAWNSFQFKSSIMNKFRSVYLSLSLPENTFIESSELYIDDIYLIPAKISSKRRSKFLYLHYTTTHSPHVVPFSMEHLPELTADNSKHGETLISQALSDSLFINNVKFTSQTALFAKWRINSDNIVDHMTGYNHQILYCDNQLKTIVEYLKKTKQFENTLFIITSDHGEEFLDHGFVDHSSSVYNECLHVPFVMVYGQSLPQNKRIQENTALIDIYPTIMDIISPKKDTLKTIEPQVQGKSLLPLIFGNDDLKERIIFATYFKIKQIAAIYKNWKIIDVDSNCFKTQLLFDLKKDLYEKSPIENRDLKIFKFMSSAIQNYKASIKNLKKTQAAQITKNAKLIDSLAQLGYVEVKKTSKEGATDIYCKYNLLSKFILSVISNAL